MNLEFDKALAASYKSSSQKIRKMGEQWVIDNLFCLKCGGTLNKFSDNHPVGDAYCAACKEEYELKCKKNSLAPKIVDGAYMTMIEKIMHGSMPNLILLAYIENKFVVNDTLIIPKHFFVPDLIIKRPPLKQTAKRPSWVGCIINLAPIPDAGKLYIVRKGKVFPKNDILERFKQMSFVNKENIESRGWLLDVMKCVEQIGKEEFSINDIYAFVPHLQKLHPENHHVEAKIRQQLQKLRDEGYIAFTGRGKYSLAAKK